MHLAVTLVALALSGAQAFSSGAPAGACGDMVPQHHAPAQTSAAPYTVTTSTKLAKAGTPMQVVITGNGAADTIKGLLLQARHDGKPVGTFSLNKNSNARLLDCGREGNSVTHKSTLNDEKTIAFTWTPPKDFSGIVKFRATVLKSAQVFWVGVESADIKVQ